MKPSLLASLTLLLLLAANSALADWPQWRGPLRNGTVPESVPLPDELTDANAPAKLWESETIPSDHDGGHGSVAVSGGKVILSVVWHEDVPTDTRKIDNRVMGKLGHRGTSRIEPEVLQNMEEERMTLGRRLRGTALDEWAQKWVEENLDEKTQLSLGSWVIGRFKQGKEAVPLSVYAVLETISKREFANQAEMEAWVKQQNFGEEMEQRIISAVPNTKKVASDVVVCVDAESGETVWKFETPGFPSGRGASSTPAFAGGKVYAALSTHLYCLNAADGAEVWRAPLTGRKGPASSPLVAHERVYLQQNALTAFDAATGEELWQVKEVSGSNPSPAIWKNVIICNSGKDVAGVNAETGEVLWTQPGGGDGTPVVSGDHLVISSKSEGQNLIAYHLTEAGPEKLWAKDFLARRYGSSPIIHDGYVYHLGSERHLCLDLKTGETAWERQASSSISSPVLADGKLFVYENRGGFLSMLKATPDDYTALGRAKVGALFCASPAIVGKRIYLRTQGSVACFEFGG